MKISFKKTGAAAAAVATLVACASAEVGVGVGNTLRSKAHFNGSSTALYPGGGAGAPVAGIDHEYVDGFNRVDSSGNAGGLTSYWGYDNAAQYDASGTGTLTFNGTATSIDSGAANDGKTGREPSLLFYWQEPLHTNDNLVVGIRAALRWQHINIRQKAVAATLDETVQDAYDLGGVIPPGAPFSGSFTGPNALISDTPVRTVTSSTAGAINLRRKLRGDLLVFDLGPTLSVDLSEKVRLVGRVGASVAWSDCEYIYSEGTLDGGSDAEDQWMFGAHAGADLQFQVEEHWGCFAGIAYNYLEDLQFAVDGRTAELEFGGSYFLLGLYYR